MLPKNHGPLKTTKRNFLSAWINLIDEVSLFLKRTIKIIIYNNSCNKRSNYFMQNSFLSISTKNGLRF